MLTSCVSGQGNRISPVCLRVSIWAREDGVMGCKSHNIVTGEVRTDSWGATSCDITSRRHVKSLLNISWAKKEDYKMHSTECACRLGRFHFFLMQG